MSVLAIITCAGSGTRAGFGFNKLFAKINGMTVIEKTVKKFFDNNKIKQIIITYSADDLIEIKNILNSYLSKIIFVEGGKTRSQSVYNALKIATEPIVLIHDGARAFVANSIIDNCIDSVVNFSSGVTCVESTDTLGIVENNKIKSTLRNGVYRLQTPQAFLTKDILFAYNQNKNNLEDFTDDVGVYCTCFDGVNLVKGDSENIKLTLKTDFDNSLHTNHCSNHTIGTGYDLHKLVQGRKLILGGVDIPHSKGLLGHSDADVLTHAIMDALLSACNSRDIGYHFSDKDSRFKDISSMILLSKVLDIVKINGYAIGNISAVIMAEKPKLSPHIENIASNLANALGVNKSKVNLTCTTLEGIGIVGREEGIACNATCILYKLEV